MKRKVILSICIMMSILLFTGCMSTISTLSATTSKYRTYNTFYKYHKTGMDKEEILDMLGCPVRYEDEQGTWHRITYNHRTDFVENISSDSSMIWQYDCYELKDQTNPYILEITFDSDGKSENVEFNIIYGG